jgi:hypothetical protein
MNLYAFTENLGDGSSRVVFTQDKELVKKLQGSMDYPYDPYEDFGEGKMTLLTLPDDTDIKSLGVKIETYESMVD